MTGSRSSSTSRRSGRADATGDEAAALRRLLPAGGTAPEVLAVFDRLAPVPADALPGRWRGRSLPTGHRFDGLLEAYGWYGKEVVDQETVHPLLFRSGNGRPRPIAPRGLPVRLLRDRVALARNPVARGAFVVLRPALWTRSPQARVRLIQHRGVLTAALLYDRLPVIDVLRRGGADMLLGMMDLRGLDDPFFFVLERDPA